jgi:hypothetical protein
MINAIYMIIMDIFKLKTNKTQILLFLGVIMPSNVKNYCFKVSVIIIITITIIIIITQEKSYEGN